MTLCYIQARGGSKRFPRKNVALWNGTPMVEDAIRKAKAASLFDFIAVSSDDMEILEIAARCGVLPLWRTPEACTDTATDNDVTLEVLRYFPKVEWVCKLYPCIPLLSVDDLRKAWHIGKNIYSVDEKGKDAGAFYIFQQYRFHQKNIPWEKYILTISQDINTREDFEETKRKAGL